MVQIERILEEAIKRDASDIHLIRGNKPMLRIIRDLVPVRDTEVLTEDDMSEIYDYFIRGNIERDKVFAETRKIDMSFEYGETRLRVNVSLENDIPLFTLRIIKNTLPPYDSLGIPEVVRNVINQPQGLILVTGKTNSGKTTTLNALINEINENSNKKILTLENPVEYRHKSKQSIIVQKEIGAGKDSPSFSAGVKNSLREDCDIVVIRRN